MYFLSPYKLEPVENSFPTGALNKRFELNS